MKEEARVRRNVSLQYPHGHMLHELHLLEPAGLLMNAELGVPGEASS